MNHAEALEFLKYLPIWKPALLRGPSGIGKTALVHQLCSQTKLIVLHPAEMDPTDLVGLPYINAGTTEYAKPSWWPEKDATIFIEEIDRCDERMFPVVMQLVLDRTAGGRRLPSGCRIFASCNGIKFMTQSLDQALVRRFAVIDYQPTVAEWLAWAERSAVHKSILDYISACPTALDTPDSIIGQRNRQIPCRATWVDASEWISKRGKLPEIEKLAKNIAPFVGEDAAKAFEFWYKTKESFLDPMLIADGKVAANQVSLLQAAQAAGKTAEVFMKIDEKKRSVILDFYLDVGREAFASLFTQLPKEASDTIKAHRRAHAEVVEIAKAIR